MKKTIITSAVFAALALASLSSSAMAANDFTPQQVTEMKAALKKNHADMPEVNSVKPTNISGLFEVVVNRAEVFYATKDGKTLIFGNMITSENGKQINLTDRRVQELTAIDFKTFDLKDAVVRKIGNGKDKIVTFEDPNCGFCKKLQPELAQLKDVTVYTFIIPILGEASKEVSKKIMCSADQLKAWDAYMGKEHTVPSISDSELAKCDTSTLDRNVNFARKYKIQGTPAIFFENGRAIKGYAPAAKIMDVMKQPKK